MIFRDNIAHAVLLHMTKCWRYWYCALQVLRYGDIIEILPNPNIYNIIIHNDIVTCKHISKFQKVTVNN